MWRIIVLLTAFLIAEWGIVKLIFAVDAWWHRIKNTGHGHTCWHTYRLNDTAQQRARAEREHREGA